MLKKVIVFLILGLTLISLPKPISAHVLKTDGSIGATLHINPDDDPIIGEPATFFFDIKDKDSKFDSSKCTCLVTILQENQEIYTANLFENSSIANLNTPSFSYTFPEKGIYLLRLSGTPNPTGSFQAFKLEIDLRVDRASSEKNNLLGHNLHFFAIGAIIIAFLFFFFLGRKPGKTKGLKLLVLVLTFGLIGLVSTHLHVSDATKNLASTNHECCLPTLAQVEIDLKLNSEEKVEPLLLLDPTNSTETLVLTASSRSPPTVA